MFPNLSEGEKCLDAGPVDSDKSAQKELTFCYLKISQIESNALFSPFNL